jgi:hypothetical protein
MNFYKKSLELPVFRTFLVWKNPKTYRKIKNPEEMVGFLGFFPALQTGVAKPGCARA